VNQLQTRAEAVSEDDWPAIAESFSDLGFEQTLSYSKAAARRIGGETQFLAVKRGDRIIAAAALRLKTLPGLGRGVVWIPSGPLVRRNNGGPVGVTEVMESLVALRNKVVMQDGHILRLRLPATAFLGADELQERIAGAGYTETDRAASYRTFIVDLGNDEDTLMRNLNGKWRTDLRAASKAGLALDVGCDSSIQARFLKIFEPHQARKEFRPEISPQFHFALAGAAYPLDILMATKDGVDVAGIVVGRAGPTATYLFGATSLDGRQLKAGYFLTWQGILKSRLAGCLWYDLGGVDFDINPDVARFKQRIGGIEVVSAPYEARPGGLVPRIIGGLEAVRWALRERRKRVG